MLGAKRDHEDSYRFGDEGLTGETSQGESQSDEGWSPRDVRLYAGESV